MVVTNRERIVLFFPFLYPWVSALRKELLKEHVVLWLGRGQFGNYPFDEIEGMYDSYLESNVLSTWVTLIKKFMRFRPTCAILYGAETPEAIVLAILSRALRLKFVFVVEENAKTIHKVRIQRILRDVKDGCVRGVYRTCRKFIAESQASKNYVISYFGVRKEQVRVIPHGVDTDEFSPHLSLSDAKRQFGIGSNQFVVLFVGSLIKEKGVEILQNSIKLVASKMSIGEDPPIYLIPSELHPLSDEIRIGNRLFDDPNVSQYVRRYKRGNRSDLFRLYSCCDILVLPEIHQQNTSSARSPNSIIEAMAMGKPVVATSVGGIPTYLGRAGILIPPGDSASLADAILLLKRDDVLRQELSKLALLRIKDDLSMKIYVNRLLEFLLS